MRRGAPRMSNTESVRQSGANTAPIHSSSISKLRSIGGGGISLGLGESDATNWLDAFAEIFARMAASDAAPKNSQSSLDPELQQTDSTIHQADHDRSDADDQNVERAEVVDSSTGEQVSLALPVTKTEVIETGPVEVVNVDTAVDLKTDDQDTETLVNVIPVENEALVVTDIESNAVDDETRTTVVETLVADDRRSKKDGKRDQGTVLPDPQDSGDIETVGTTKQVTRTEPVGPEIESGSPATFSLDNEKTTRDSDRRSRRGRDDRDKDGGSHSTVPQNSAVASASKRSGGIPVSATQSMSSESTPLPSTQSVASAADSSPKPANASALAVQAAAKLASSAATSGRAASATSSSGLTSNVQPANRSTTPVSESAAKKPTMASKNLQATEAVNRAKLIQRVSKAFQHLGPDGGHVRLRLAPAELGTVRLEMHMHERRIQARVVAESEAAATVLREHLPELRQRLESQGIQIERFQIDVDSSEGEPRGSLGHEHAETHQRGRDDGTRKRSTSTQPDGDDVSQKVSRYDSLPGEFGGPLVTVPIHGGVDVRL